MCWNADRFAEAVLWPFQDMLNRGTENNFENNFCILRLAKLEGSIKEEENNLAIKRKNKEEP